MKKMLLAVTMTALSMQAFADECQVELTGNDQMKYSLAEITVPKSCAEFTINFKNVGKLPRTAMGHNVVIAKTADKMAISTDGIAAGLDNQYVKPDDERIFAHSDVVGGGEETTLKFPTEKLVAGEDYSFFCTFPGHIAIMNGKLIVK